MKYPYYSVDAEKLIEIINNNQFIVHEGIDVTIGNTIIDRFIWCLN